MRKIFTSILFLLPFLTFAQGPWNFDTTTEGFICKSSSGAGGSHVVARSGGDLSVSFVAGTGNNPVISNTTAGFNAETNNFIEIRLKNLSSATYLRFGSTITSQTDGSNYGDLLISANDADYKTYTIDVTAWVGNPVGMVIVVKKNTISSGAGTAYTPVGGESILIDYIKPLVNIATPEVNVFNFDTTNDNFTTLTRATAVQSTESGKGTLKVNCTTANANNAKVSLSSLVAHVEGTNKYAHITLKNTSTNTLFQLNGKVGGVGTAFNPIQTYTTSDAAYKTYDFDLSTWDNGYQFPELNFGVMGTWLSTANYAIGDIVISGNTYCKNTSGANSVLPAVPHTDTANWVIVNAAGAVADAAPATNGAILGGALDINASTNSVYVDQITFDNVAPVLSIRDIFSPITGKKKKVTTISLYPNPTKETLNIEAKFEVNKIEIYNLAGQNVLQNQNSNKIDVINLDKGVYFVKVTQKYGDPEFLKFIKD
jgi:hypothetical protein